MGGVVDIAAHVVLHHHADLLADLLAHHLTADFGFRLPDHVAGIIGHVVHHIRGDQVTAVDGGRHSRGHLDQGELLGLTEGGGIEVGDHVLHFLLGFGDAPGLKGQVNSGGLGQAKGLIVVIEEIRIHLLGGLDKVEVAALVERPRHVQPAVGAALGAAVGVLPFGTLKYRQAAAAVKLLAGIHQAGIQRGGGRHELKDRAGIIQFCHSLVFPLGLPDHALKRNFFAGNFLFGPVVLNLGAGLGADHAVGNQIRHVVLAQAALQGGDLLRREGAARVVQNGLEFGFRDGIGIIGVELGLGGHAINGAGLDIHHNGAAAVLDIVILNGLGQLGFQNALDIIVDGQVKIGAVDGIMGVGFLVGQLIAPGVLAADGAARRAGKLFVIGFFQPVYSAAVAAAEAQNRREEGTAGVFPGGGGLLVHGKDLLLFGVFIAFGQTVGHPLGVGIVNHGLGGHHIHAGGNDTVLLVGAAELCLNLFRSGGAAQQLTDFLTGLLHIVLIALGRVGDDVPHHRGLGQQFAGGGIDGTACGGNPLIGKLLFGGLNPVLLRVAKLQHIELVNEQAKTEDDENRHNDQRAQTQRQVSHMALLGFAAGRVGFLGHGSVPSVKRYNVKKACSGWDARLSAKRKQITDQSCRSG